MHTNIHKIQTSNNDSKCPTNKYITQQIFRHQNIKKKGTEPKDWAKGESKYQHPMQGQETCPLPKQKPHSDP